MTELFDTHCHLFMDPLADSYHSVLCRAGEAGVSRILVPAVSRNSWRMCRELTGFPGIRCALGVHPWWAEEGIDADLLQRTIVSTGACAVGEIGLDWKYPVERSIQHHVFKSQLKLAADLDLPVVLHCRGAFDEMLQLLSEFPVTGVIHGWSSHPDLMKRFLDAGLYIAFGGAVTLSGAVNARASAALVPSDRFVLETDAPSMWLKGIPAGKSEPAHLAGVLGQMALLRDQSAEQTAEQSVRNGLELFGLYDE